MSQYYNLEAEQSVLGSILLEPELIYECSIQWEEFYATQHRTIFEAYQKLKENSISIDLVTITEILGDKVGQAGGIEYILNLSNAVPTTANFKHHCSVIRDKHLMRKTMTTIRSMFKDGENAEGPEELINKLQEASLSLSQESQQERTFRSMSDVLENHDEVLEERSTKNGLTGVKTASIQMDKLTGGYQKQDFIVIAARPSVGKTAYMLNDALRAAESTTVDAVGIISLEMPDMPIAERLISATTHIDGMKIRTGRLDGEDWQKYTMGRQHIANIPLLIDDSPGLTIQQIASKVRTFKKKHGRIIIYIDYLQLISGGKRFANTQEEVSYISKQLKQIAKENDCPVVAISSLSRSVEQRQDKRPMMSDLRESGQIEFDADMVIFLYRDDYYNSDSEKKNIVEVNVAKGRNTGTGLIEMVYMKNYSKFLDLDYSHHT